MSRLRRRYRAWARDVPESCRRRDWRLHPLALYRSRAWMNDDHGWRTIEATVRELVGLPPVFRYRVRLMPWGFRGRYDLPLRLR